MKNGFVILFYSIHVFLKTYVTPELSTIQDFMTPYDYNELIHSAKRKSKNYVEFVDHINEMKRYYLLEHHKRTY